MATDSTGFRAMRYVLLAAAVMGYGWAYRGTVGHEAGAMVPGALLGLVLCLGSGRADWERRGAVAGLLGAVGWAWGGMLSYMEQTFYVLSDSFPDVLYGYAMLFFLGALWAGCGGAILGLAWTLPRSEIDRLIRPFAAVCTVFLAVYLYFLAMPAHREAYETFTVVHFHDGDWLSATLTLAVSAIYFVLRPKDRRATILFLGAAAAWWLSYGLLTKWGGLRLAPLHRSESWGGLLGVLIFLALYLGQRENRAALLLCIYGILGGGLAFVCAVFLHNLLVLRWGPFGRVSLPLPAWRTAEMTFGAFMGFALALGTLRLIRGGLAPAEEDAPRSNADVFAVFVILVALPWMNFRRHGARWLAAAGPADNTAFLGLTAGGWILVLAALATMPALCGLYRYRQGDRTLAPASAFGKGAAVCFLLLGMTLSAQLFDGLPTRQHFLGHLCLWLPAALGIILLMAAAPSWKRERCPVEATVLPSDARWRPGKDAAAVCALVPVVLLAVAWLSITIQDAPLEERSRLRFGPEAYWQQTARLQGDWQAVGLAQRLDDTALRTKDLPLAGLRFDAYRNVTAVLPSGERAEKHRWFLKNQYIWLDWNAKGGAPKDRAEVPLQFQGEQIYIAWPPNSGGQGYLVLERRAAE